MAKQQFNRLIWLVDTIYRSGRITFSEINRRWRTGDAMRTDIPLRTFHNHRQAIEEMFDINIECDKRTNTYYIADAEGMLGNHETKMKAKEHIYRNEYLEYQAELKQKGICFLANEKSKVVLAGNSFVVNGLELPLEYYHKPFSPKLTSEKMEELMGKPDPEAINILLAHNPKYGRTYFHWGADLILSGHYHGGVLRFSRHVGAISSQFIPFPKYCCGDFYKNGKCMIVSAGLGEHTVPLRIHNPRELIFIEMKP